MRRLAKFRGHRSNRASDMTIFRCSKNVSRPPSWICYERVRTTHEKYLVVFITIQTFAGIDAVVSINQFIYLQIASVKTS